MGLTRTSLAPLAGRHRAASNDTRFKGFVRFLRSLPSLSRLSLGYIRRARHGKPPGSLRVVECYSGSLKIHGYSNDGFIELWAFTGDPEQLVDEIRTGCKRKKIELVAGMDTALDAGDTRVKKSSRSREIVSAQEGHSSPEQSGLKIEISDGQAWTEVSALAAFLKVPLDSLSQAADLVRRTAALVTGSGIEVLAGDGAAARLNGSAALLAAAQVGSVELRLQVELAAAFSTVLPFATRGAGPEPAPPEEAAGLRDRLDKALHDAEAAMEIASQMEARLIRVETSIGILTDQLARAGAVTQTLVADHDPGVPELPAHGGIGEDFAGDVPVGADFPGEETSKPSLAREDQDTRPDRLAVADYIAELGLGALLPGDYISLGRRARLLGESLGYSYNLPEHRRIRTILHPRSVLSRFEAEIRELSERRKSEARPSSAKSTEQIEPEEPQPTRRPKPEYSWDPSAIDDTEDTDDTEDGDDSDEAPLTWKAPAAERSSSDIRPTDLVSLREFLRRKGRAIPNAVVMRRLSLDIRREAQDRSAKFMPAAKYLGASRYPAWLIEHVLDKSVQLIASETDRLDEPDESSDGPYAEERRGGDAAEAVVEDVSAGASDEGGTAVKSEFHGEGDYSADLIGSDPWHDIIPTSPFGDLPGGPAAGESRAGDENAGDEAVDAQEAAFVLHENGVETAVGRSPYGSGSEDATGIDLQHGEDAGSEEEAPNTLVATPPGSAGDAGPDAIDEPSTIIRDVPDQDAAREEPAQRMTISGFFEHRGMSKPDGQRMRQIGLRVLSRGKAEGVTYLPEHKSASGTLHPVGLLAGMEEEILDMAYPDRDTERKIA